MGQMTAIAPVADAGRLIVTPHPVLLDGRTNTPADLLPGESLYAFLSRHVDLAEQWEVRVGGEVVPVEMWMRVKPKHGQVIEVVHAVNRQALMLVAMVALTYFTFGAGTIAGWGIGGTTAAGAFTAKAAVYVAGSILINKVLGPKPPEPVSAVSRDSVHSITSARNQARPYDAVALLLGRSYITPDLASMPYIWHEGDDQYLGMVLNVGINVHDVGDIYHGEGLLSQFDGVQVYYNGIPGKPNQTIPLYSNADTIEGGELEKTTAWVQRTTPPNTRRIQLNIEGTIGDRTSKGKDYYNAETIQSEYRPVGSTAWLPLVTRVISNANGKNFEIQRVTLSRDVAEGQYDVRVRRLYTAQDVDKGDQYWSAQTQFQWTTMVAVQTDEATYAGMGRIGIRVRATGQLSGALDQLRMEAWSRPIPVWNGTAWVTEATSNPGALILQFLRGIHDENGRIIAGLGLDEDEIDIPSLQAFMVHCAANGYEYNHYLRDVRNNGDQLDAMARAGFGAMSWESGRWGVVWAADGQPVSGVVNMATIKKGQFQVDYTLAQSADGVEYTYLDSADWTAKTLRVPAPGVDVMLNPATVQAEGVSTEAHAAQMARWHLAQSLYQYKDIVFSTDLEHLAYKRMDVLQLQHDLTQWGYGGRLVAVDGSTLTLDEPVPGNSVAWIGVRVPGEAVYRTLRVQAFTGESDTVTLLDPWPGDAPLPDADNPAHDYIWIYDFKATPGYRVRVVGKELESDAKGASVAVVPESPEFWNYVKTGEYIPPQPGSLLDTRPKASNVVVSEVQVITGDVVHTELAVTFDLKGPAARTVIFAGVQGSEIGPVAETVTQTARFRIGSAGTYTIVVRPYNADGIAGEAATVTYTTEGTDIPPPPFDWVSVEAGQSGLRRYAWGYHQFQPADLAGAEIRFMPGTVADPDWEAMTPLGGDGFFTAAFESDVPAAGDWTFAFAAINTAGELSAPVVTHVTLTENVGEHLQDHEDRIQSTEQLAQEILNDFADMAQQIDDVAAQAAADAAALNLRADQLRDDIDATMAQLNDILGAEEWDAATAYDEGTLVQFDGKLYRAIQNVPAGTPTSNAAYWELIGDYASLGDAVAAALSQLSAHADELQAHAESLNLLGAKNGAGTAWLLNMDTVRVSASETMAQWRSSLQADFGNVNARIDAEETARADGDSALATTLATVQATADNAATKAELTSAQNALTAADQALGERIDVTEATIRGVSTVVNPGFEDGAVGWASSTTGEGVLPAGVSIPSNAANAYSGSRYLLLAPNDGSGRQVFNRARFAAKPNEVIRLRMQTRTAGPTNAGAQIRLGIREWKADGTWTNRYAPYLISPGGTWLYPNGVVEGDVTLSAEAAFAQALIYSQDLTQGSILCDSVQVDRETLTDEATAQLIAVTRAEVSNIDDVVTAHTSQIAAQSVAIGTAQSTADDAAAAASSAHSAAQAASDLAGGKGKVFFQSSAPPVAERLPQNLWIDTTGGANTPKRWNGSTWAAVTDKAATDAAAAAAAALAAAQAAQGTATAAANAVDAVELTVQQQGTTLSAHGLSIDGLEATADGHTASINELREVAVSAVAGNAVINPSFEQDDGWQFTDTNIYIEDRESSAVTGTRILRIDPGAGHAFNTASVAVHTGQRIRLGGVMRARGSIPNSEAKLQLIARRYTAGGSYINYTPVASFDRPGSYSDHPFEAAYVIPAGTGRVAFQITSSSHTSGAFAIDDVYLEPESNALAEMGAKYSLAVTAGGDVAGMQLLAGGGTSAIRFLANSMDVVDPGGASGWSLVDGIATWRKGSHMVVIGPGFGANNEFMYWSGPIQSNLANCRRNNAIRYETVTGESFQRGGIIAGTRVHSGFNPALSVPSIYTTPTLGTGGNPIAITASVSYFRQFSTNNNAGRFTPGSGSNTATLQLWRKIGSGAWSMVSSQTFTGSLQIIGEPTTSDQALWNINGAITYTDTAGGTQNRQYEARLVTRTLQAVSVQNPAHNIVPVAEQQSVGIVTEEDP